MMKTAGTLALRGHIQPNWRQSDSVEQRASLHRTQVRKKIMTERDPVRKEQWRMHLDLMNGTRRPEFVRDVLKAMKHSNHPKTQGFWARLFKSQYKPYAFQLFVKEYIGIQISDSMAAKLAEHDADSITGKFLNMYIHQVVK